ncbi:hypothetical protein D3C84_1004280 [compost metagenome]
MYALGHLWIVNQAFGASMKVLGQPEPEQIMLLFLLTDAPKYSFELKFLFFAAHYFDTPKSLEALPIHVFHL